MLAIKVFDLDNLDIDLDHDKHFVKSIFSILTLTKVKLSLSGVKIKISVKHYHWPLANIKKYLDAEVRFNTHHKCIRNKHFIDFDKNIKNPYS